MAHICTINVACHAEVNFTLVSMCNDVKRSRCYTARPSKCSCAPAACTKNSDIDRCRGKGIENDLHRPSI